MAAKKTTSTKKPSPKSKSAASRKGRAAQAKAKPTSPTKKKKTGNAAVTVDRRRADRRQDKTDADPAPKLERRAKVQRRRQIDPTTCERDYSDQEVQFMNALDEYKRKSGRMFPTCSEVLEVIRDLGYVQLTPAEMALARPQASDEQESETLSGEQAAEAGKQKGELEAVS